MCRRQSPLSDDRPLGPKVHCPSWNRPFQGGDQGGEGFGLSTTGRTEDHVVPLGPGRLGPGDLVKNRRRGRCGRNDRGPRSDGRFHAMVLLRRAAMCIVDQQHLGFRRCRTVPRLHQYRTRNLVLQQLQAGGLAGPGGAEDQIDRPQLQNCRSPVVAPSRCLPSRSAGEGVL